MFKSCDKVCMIFLEIFGFFAQTMTSVTTFGQFNYYLLLYTNSQKLSGLKQPPFINSQFLRLKNLGVTQVCGSGSESPMKLLSLCLASGWTVCFQAHSHGCCSEASVSQNVCISIRLLMIQSLPSSQSKKFQKESKWESTVLFMTCRFPRHALSLPFSCEMGVIQGCEQQESGATGDYVEARPQLMYKSKLHQIHRTTRSDTE